PYRRWEVHLPQLPPRLLSCSVRTRSMNIQRSVSRAWLFLLGEVRFSKIAK
ncbi:hypothetical protein KI387_003507, partial [Taxus chinensis]